MKSFYELNEDGSYAPANSWTQVKIGYSILRSTHIEKQERISTVFLSIDHGFGLSPLPVLFETMIFDSIGNSLYEFQERYSFIHEAILGHFKVIEWLHWKSGELETVMSREAEKIIQSGEIIVYEVMSM